MLGNHGYFAKCLDRIASLVTRASSVPVLVDGLPWDGSQIGDVAIVMTPNQNVVRQHQKVAAACMAAGLELAFVYADLGASWTPALPDYALPGARIVKLPLRGNGGGLRFPNPFVLLAMSAELRALFPRAPFATLVTHLDDYGMCKLLCYWARLCEIPSIVLQEGMMLTLAPGAEPRRDLEKRGTLRAKASWLIRHVPHDLFRIRVPYVYADYFCAYGEAGRREIVRHGRLKETVFVVGNPSFDHVTGLPEPIPVRKGRNTLLYVQQDIVERGVELQFFEELAAICCDEADNHLVVKLHPHSLLNRHALLQVLLTSEARARLLEVRDRGDAADMLEEVDVLLTVTSTTAYHALVRGVPVITVNYLTEGFGEFDAFEYGGVIDVRSPHDLRKAIYDAVTNEELRYRLHDGASRVIEQHLFRLDGGASDRIAQVVVEVAQARTEHQSR